MLIFRPGHPHKQWTTGNVKLLYGNKDLVENDFNITITATGFCLKQVRMPTTEWDVPANLALQWKVTLILLDFFLGWYTPWWGIYHALPGSVFRVSCEIPHADREVSFWTACLLLSLNYQNFVSLICSSFVVNLIVVFFCYWFLSFWNRFTISQFFHRFTTLYNASIHPFDFWIITLCIILCASPCFTTSINTVDNRMCHEHSGERLKCIKNMSQQEDTGFTIPSREEHYILHSQWVLINFILFLHQQTVHLLNLPGQPCLFFQKNKCLNFISYKD